MANDADSFGIHLRTLGQHVPRISGSTAEHGERLHCGIFDRGIIGGIGAAVCRFRATDGEHHESTADQLQRVISEGILPYPDR